MSSGLLGDLLRALWVQLPCGLPPSSPAAQVSSGAAVHQQIRNAFMAADALSTHNHVIFCALVVAVTAGQRSTTGSLIAPMHSGRTSPRAALSSSSGHRRDCHVFADTPIPIETPARGRGECSRDSLANDILTPSLLPQTVKTILQTNTIRLELGVEQQDGATHNQGGAMQFECCAVPRSFETPS